ncbi:MAG TPA: NAD(P)-dependent oxidoreductase [Solirubrobacteraceae bacterium]|nr:NAD(P)-dependent oxidoreductase [Solirubrobacteraceae bacterium]
MTILVTGASGLIGREFLQTADSESEEIVALARDPAAIDATALGRAQWLPIDLRDPGFARKLPGRADAIVNLAQAREYRDFPASAVDIFDVNLGATARLLDYALGAGVQRFVFASTGTMYESSHAPLTERSPILCASYYAASKRAAELLIGQYRELFGCWLMRIFTVYGVGQRDQLVANLTRRVAGEEPVPLQGTSGLPVSPIHAADVARALWQAATVGDAAPESGCEALNIGGAQALTIRDLAQEIGKALGVPARFECAAGDDPPGWVADRRLLDRRFALAEPLAFADGIRQVLSAEGVVSVTRG